MAGPCAWPISYAACATCTPLENMHPDEREKFEEMAAQYLWNWTLKAYGLCEVTVRPCRRECAPSTFGGSTSLLVPMLVGGQWINLACGSCRQRCRCAAPHQVLLPGPVEEVLEVLVDGEVLDPESYRVDGHRLLVRTDGEPWPVCQDLGQPTTEEGTWSVEYVQGRPVPMGGQVAAGILACELAKAACDDGSCALPKRLASLTRQGVTIAILDSFDDIDKGHTGIWLIDSWVASITQPMRASSVHSVDVRPRRV